MDEAALLRIEAALFTEWDQPGALTVEVEAHLDEHTVRGIALQSTARLKRGVRVNATGGPITVPANQGRPTQ